MAISSFRAELDRLKSAVTGLNTRVGSMFTTLVTRLNAHVAETGNVHGMEAEDIGLGNVPNYAPATQDQAAKGLSNTALMTPRRVDDYAAANIYATLETAFQNAADRL